MKLSDTHPEMEGWESVEPKVDLQPNPQIPNSETTVTPFLRTTLPLPFQYSPDTLKQYNRPGLSSFRTSPLPPSGNPAINSAAQTVSQTVVQNTPGIDLQTNGVDNSSQTKLNLIAGSNVSLKSDASGGVTVASTGTGDGLTHPLPPWPSDPGYIIEREDFLSIGASATAAEGAALPANFTAGSGATWNFVSSTFAADPPYWVPGGPIPNLGLLGVPNNGTAGQANFLLKGPQTPHGMPLLDYPGWKMTWIFQLSRVRNFPNGGIPTPAFSMAQTSMYVGLANWAVTTTGAFANTTSPRPPFFLGLRFDTDTTAPAIGDSVFVFEYVNQPIAATYTRNNTQGTTVSTGMAATDGTWYRFDMSCAQSGQVTMSLSNGTTTFTSTLNISPIVANTGGGVAPTSVSITGNAVRLVYGTNSLPIAKGSEYTIDYSNGSTVLIQGTFTQFDTSTAGAQIVDFFGNTSSGGVAHASITFFPSYTPIFVFGNDSQAAPTGWNKGVFIDYYSFVWNPNLSSSAPGTINLVKSRGF